MSRKSSDQTLAILTHILGLFTSFLGPLIVFLVSEDKTVKKHSKYALNWQISLIIYMAVAAILSLILIGMFLVIALSVMNLIFSVIAAVKASEKELWKYPFSISFLKIKK